MIYQQLIKQTVIGWFTGEPRDSRWPIVRRRFILQHPECSACGSKYNLEAHHIIPFHIDKSLELIESNLITLCRYCHFVHGHFHDWSKWNITVVEDVKLFRAKIADFDKGNRRKLLTCQSQ